MPARDKLVGVISEIHRRVVKEHKRLLSQWGFRVVIDPNFSSLSDKDQRRIVAAVAMTVPPKTYEAISAMLHITRGVQYVVIRAKLKK